MKRYGHRAFRLAWCLCGYAAPTVAAPGAPPAYQDTYFAGTSSAPDISPDLEAGGDAPGLARSLQLDGVVSALATQSAGNSTRTMENGIIGKAQWDTATYGAWSLDASARTGGSGAGPSEQGQGGVVAVRQRGVPFDGGWQADNAVGDLNGPEVGIAKLQPRFYFPMGPMQGATTDWHGPSGLEIAAGAGVPGVYDGILVPNFHTLGGSTGTAGAQWSPASAWTVGGQFIEARNVNPAVGQIVDGGSSLSSETALMSAAWHEQNERLQLSVLNGSVSGKGSGAGAWLDGSITQGRMQQSAGLFRIDPGLTWGNQLIANDLQGGYYRLDYQSRRWLADIGIDEVRSVSGGSADTTFLTGNTRYQLSRDSGIGGIVDFSRTNGGSNWSAEGYVDHANRWGTGRVQAEFARTGAGVDDTLTLDQTWTTNDTLRLSTAVSLERVMGVVYDGHAEDSTLLGISAFGGGHFTSRLGMEGNIRWLTAVQGRSPPGTSANLSLTYQATPHWEFLATYYDSRSAPWTQLTVVSPLAPPIPTAVSGIAERGVFLTFRYKQSSGVHFAPLGGPSGGASGEISGVVYLDANGNGHPDGGEAGAANMTVTLDGRYSVQTDANGRFFFPAVATGHHRIVVQTDNLPLPWALVDDGAAAVEVSTRRVTEVEVAAQRMR